MLGEVGFALLAGFIHGHMKGIPADHSLLPGYSVQIDKMIFSTH